MIMKRAIFDLIKKAKFFTAKGWKGKKRDDEW